MAHEDLRIRIHLVRFCGVEPYTSVWRPVDMIDLMSLVR